MADSKRKLENLVSMPLWDAAEGRLEEEAREERVTEPEAGQARRIGLFVDAENVRLGVLGEVLEELKTKGDVPVRRAFGHWQYALSGDDAEVQALHGIELLKCPKLNKGGKNAADIAMTVNVMEVLSRGEVDVFALVSSDCDFTPLVHHLQRAGKEVWGYGVASTPDSLRLACTCFEEIGVRDGEGVQAGDDESVMTSWSPRKERGEAKEAKGVFTDREVEILKRIMKKLGQGKWLRLSVLSDVLKADAAWSFKRHQGKLGKRLETLEWVERHTTDTQLVRIRE